MAAFLVLVAGLPVSEVGAQTRANNNGQRITPHFKDAEIGQVIEAVAAATGKTIIPDVRVRAQVTMLSTTPMTPDSPVESQELSTPVTA
jgi:general secretion pathway protein D